MHYKEDVQCKQSYFSMGTSTVDILAEREIVDKQSLQCILSCVSLHVSTSSLKLTPTLIYWAPDLLLFCHPDMFNKYCLVQAG